MKDDENELFDLEEQDDNDEFLDIINEVDFDEEDLSTRKKNLKKEFYVKRC